MSLCAAAILLFVSVQFLLFCVVLFCVVLAFLFRFHAAQVVAKHETEPRHLLHPLHHHPHHSPRHKVRMQLILQPKFPNNISRPWDAGKGGSSSASSTLLSTFTAPVAALAAAAVLLQI